jgi:hypothetical protein
MASNSPVLKAYKQKGRHFLCFHWEIGLICRVVIISSKPRGESRFTAIHRDSPRNRVRFTAIHRDSPRFTAWLSVGSPPGIPAFRGVPPQGFRLSAIHRDSPRFTAIHRDSPRGLKIGERFPCSQGVLHAQGAQKRSEKMAGISPVLKGFYAHQGESGLIGWSFRGPGSCRGQARLPQQ